MLYILDKITDSYFKLRVYHILPYLLIITQAGIIKMKPIMVFQMGNNAKEVCDHNGKAIRAGSKSGIQISRENTCKSIFAVSLLIAYIPSYYQTNFYFDLNILFLISVFFPF